MPRSVTVCVLVSVMFFLETVGAADKDVAEGLHSRNSVSKTRDKVRDFIRRELMNTDHSNENVKHSSTENHHLDIFLAISTLRRAFEDEKLVHRQNYDKLDTAMSKLHRDIEAMKTDKMQTLAELQSLNQALIDVRKKQDDVVGENKQFMSTQNQLTVANSQKIAGLEQHGKDLKTEILAVVEKAFEDHTNQYKTLIKEAVDNKEKCQSGTIQGPFSFPNPPSYPYRHTVWFQPPFKNTPALGYGLTFLDSYKGANLRVHAYIVELTNTYFMLEITTWADTYLYGAYLSWMACPK